MRDKAELLLGSVIVFTTKQNEPAFLLLCEKKRRCSELPLGW